MNDSSDLTNILTSAAQVELYDESDGIFGELISPDEVMAALATGGAVPTGAQVATSALSFRSFDFAPVGSESTEIPVEFNNASNDRPLRIRWINARGENPSTHIWTVDPSQSTEQYTRSGHLFVFSMTTVGPHQRQEVILGAYRPKRQLPSGSAHCIFVQGGASPHNNMIVEVILLNKHDALVVAAAAVDRVVGRTQEQRLKTIFTLQTIVSNIRTHPLEEKYRKLRLSNKTIHNNICSVWGAMEFLRVLGFQNKREVTGDDDTTDTEHYLVLPKTAELMEQSAELLNILKSRCSPDFIPDVAPPTPWQEPVVTGSQHYLGSSFVSPEDRWARVERASRFRRRAGRRPAPGEAPSSRGKWGR